MLCTFHLYNSPQLWNGVTVQFSRCGILLRQTIVSLQLRVCVQVFSSTTTTQGEQCVAIPQCMVVIERLPTSSWSSLYCPCSSQWLVILQANCYRNGRSPVVIRVRMILWTIMDCALCLVADWILLCILNPWKIEYKKMLATEIIIYEV